MSDADSTATARPAAAMFLAAAVVHVVVWLQYRSDPFALTYVSDALSYDRWAERLATEGLGAEPVFHQAPLFALLLAVVYGLAAEPVRAAASTGLQVLLSSAAIAALVPLGRRWMGSSAVGVSAAVLALLHAPFVFYSMKLLPVSLALLTQALGLLTLGLARMRGGALPAALAGACWGVACLARSEMLLFVPVALAALLLGAPGPTRLRWALLAAYTAGLALLVTPATLHNARRGDIVLIASSAGENLYIGNQPGAAGGYTPLHPAAGDIFSQRVAAKQIAEQESGRVLRPSAISAHWRGRTVETILEQPGAWLALELRKLGRVLHPGDPTDIYSLALERSHYLSALHLLPVAPWTLLLLGSVGALLARRDARCRVWPLGSLAGVHLIVLLVFFTDSRLRLPLLFALCPLAGYAIVEAARRWRARTDRLQVVALVLAGVATLVAGQVATRATPRDLIRLASVLSMQERLDESLAVLAPDLERESPDPLVLDQAGWVLQKKGEYVAARDRYLQALDSDLPPARARQTRTRLGMTLERLERFDEAAAQHDAAVASDSANAGTYYERAMFRLRRGEKIGALDDLQRAARIDPGWPPPRQALRTLGVAGY